MRAMGYFLTGLLVIFCFLAHATDVPPSVSPPDKVPSGDGISKTYFEDGGGVATLTRWKQGVKTLEATYYQNGFLKTQREYSDGKVIDKNFFDDGNLNSLWVSVGGIKEGPERHFDEEGHLTEEWSYVRGMLEGPAKIYHAPEKPYREEYYSRNKLVSRIEFDDEGRILSVEEWNRDGSRRTQYSADAKRGWQRVYYTKDKIRYEINFEGGLTDGDARTFFPDGQLSQRLSLRGGQKQGAEITYYQNGQVRSRLKWENDRRQGKAQYYDPFGHLIKEVAYDENILNGPATFYFPNGKVQELAVYEKGIKRSSKLFEPTGVLRGDFEFFDDGSPKTASRR